MKRVNYPKLTTNIPLQKKKKTLIYYIIKIKYFN